MLWGGLPGQGQPPAVLLHPSLRHQGELPLPLPVFSTLASTSLSSCCDVGFTAGGQDHVPARALPQLLHQQLKVLLHLLCRRRKCCCSSVSWSMVTARAGVSPLCLLLLLLFLLIRPARSALTSPVRRRPGGSGLPSATCSTDGSAKQVRRFLL